MVHKMKSTSERATAKAKETAQQDPVQSQMAISDFNQSIYRSSLATITTDTEMRQDEASSSQFGNPTIGTTQGDRK